MELMIFSKRALALMIIVAFGYMTVKVILAIAESIAIDVATKGKERCNGKIVELYTKVNKKGETKVDKHRVLANYTYNNWNYKCSLKLNNVSENTRDSNIDIYVDTKNPNKVTTANFIGFDKVNEALNFMFWTFVICTMLAIITASTINFFGNNGFEALVNSL